jgi:hypothetical protein
MRSPLSRFQTPTSPRRAVGFFGSGYPASFLVGLITQLTLDVVKTMFNGGFANGYIFFVRDGAIQAQKLDLGSYTLTGDVVRIFDDVQSKSRIFYAAFAAGADVAVAQRSAVHVRERSEAVPLDLEQPVSVRERLAQAGKRHGLEGVRRRFERFGRW